MFLSLFMVKENYFENKYESMCLAKLTRIAVVRVWFLEGAALKHLMNFFTLTWGLNRCGRRTFLPLNMIAIDLLSIENF